MVLNNLESFKDATQMGKHICSLAVLEGIHFKSVKMSEVLLLHLLPPTLRCPSSLPQFSINPLFLTSPSLSDEIAFTQVKNSAGVCIVPAYSGLFAPYWNPDANGYVAQSILPHIEIRCYEVKIEKASSRQS